MKTIETKILDTINEIKDRYINDGQLDSEMSDLACGQIQSYRQVLDWLQEEKEAEADVSIDEINEALETFDADGNECLPDDDAGYQAEKDFINDKKAMAEDIN